MRHSQLEFDFCATVKAVPVADRPAETGRHRRGRVAYLSGLAAEDSVEREYLARGYRCVAKRWSGKGGEIDLVFRLSRQLVFVEVKAGRSHDAAMARITHRQAARIAQSAEAFLGTQAAGSVTDMRIDVALVDRTGRVSILENAFVGWC